MRRLKGIMLQEWLAGGAALASCLLLWIVAPRVLSLDPDLSRLVTRAISNTLTLARMQIAAWLGTSLLALLLFHRLPLKQRLRKVVSLFRATLPLLLVIVFHQTTPLWHQVIPLPDVDSALMHLDTWLFHGTNPVLWLQHIISGPLTTYMWAVYLSWFIGFQLTIYLLVLFKSDQAWQDMSLAMVLTLLAGYMLYILVPAVGPVHAMKSMFTVDLSGNPVGIITGGIVDRFGVWRDAFPSIHVAISMLMIIYVRRYLRPLAIPYTVIGISIIFSTVYLRWHYVVDGVAGALVAMLAAQLSYRIQNRAFSRRNAFEARSSSSA